MSSDDNPIVGLKIKNLKRADQKLYVAFEWEDEIYTSFPNASLQSRVHLVSQHRGVKIANADKSVSVYSLNREMKAQNPSHVQVSHEKLGSIIIYDDIEFERNDYEVISPKQRIQLGFTLRNLGYKQSTGSEFEHATTGDKVIMTKPPRALASDILEPDSLSPEAINIVTATQGAYQIIKSEILTKEEKVKDLETLVSAIPVNLRKLRSIDIPSEWDKHSWVELIKVLEKIQAATVKFYIRNKVRGTLGRAIFKGPFEITKSHNEISYEA